jgi:hypothetical protein
LTLIESNAARVFSAYSFLENFRELLGFCMFSSMENTRFTRLVSVLQSPMLLRELQVTARRW